MLFCRNWQTLQDGVDLYAGSKHFKTALTCTSTRPNPKCSFERKVECISTKTVVCALLGRKEKKRGRRGQKNAEKRSEKFQLTILFSFVGISSFITTTNQQRVISNGKKGPRLPCKPTPKSAPGTLFEGLNADPQSISLI